MFGQSPKRRSPLYPALPCWIDDRASRLLGVVAKPYSWDRAGYCLIACGIVQVHQSRWFLRFRQYRCPISRGEGKSCF